MPKPEPKFNTLAEFVDWLVDPEREQDSPWTTHWFRGHPNRSLELRPGVLREAFARAVSEHERRADHSEDLPGEQALELAEQEINQQFQREAASLLPDNLDRVDLYFLAQHHGLPTRLLDWTTNGLAALFFTAIKHPHDDGEVIVISPSYRLTTADEQDERARILKEGPFPQRHPLVRETIRYLFGEGDRPAQPMILPVLPDLRSPRMLQQGACFTLHMPGTGPIDEQAVLRFAIPSARKPELIRALRTLGITWSTLFPDLDHVCHEIRSRWQDLGEHE